MDISGILSYVISLAIMGGIYAVFALGLNVQWGYTGLFNVGLAGFFAVGAYTSALLTTPMPEGVYATYAQQLLGLNLPFPLGILGAAVVAGILALIIGIPTLRLREDYLAIATIGVAESIRLIFNNESWLANGPRGLTGLPQPLRSWVEPQHYHYLYLIIVVMAAAVLYWAIERGIRSPWGRVLRAIREDEAAAAMHGKNVFGFKLQALVLGSAIMGIGGALYAHYVRAISPDAFTPLFGTFLIWVMLMLGGSGNNKGAILGAFLVWGIWTGSTFVTDHTLPPSWAARAPYVRFLLIGLIMEVIVLWRPQGLLGEERQVSTLFEQ
jgi:branched-chain amino acid transport system permease protein